MSSGLIVVKVAYDDEAHVWYVDHSNLAGLTGEADTVDALMARIPGLIQDLLEDDEDGCVEVPVEIIASASARVRVREAA